MSELSYEKTDDTGDSDDVILRSAKEAEEVDTIEMNKAARLEEFLAEKLYKDTSPEAKAGRRQMLVRAAYGEFMATLLFLTPIFCVVANSKANGWNSDVSNLMVAMVGGLQAVAVSFAFSSVSGAHFNPNASFALWLTGKLSNRKVVVYISVQLLASVIGMLIVTAIFPDEHEDYFKMIAVVPASDTYLGKIFATEYFTTFFLIYTAFTVAFEDAEKNKKDSMSVKTLADSRGLTVYASNPQSKTGFAPFSIGFTIFSLSLVGGTSGGAFNQARMFGPALISNRWDYFWLYYIAQFMGAATAATLVHNLHRIGLKQDPQSIDPTPLSKAVSRVRTLGKGRGKVQLKDMNPTTGINNQDSSA